MELGRRQTLYMDHRTSFGVYLREDPVGPEENQSRGPKRGQNRDRTGSRKENDSILLPGKQVPEDLAKGDPIEVFVYRDSDDRMIATTRMPLLEVGQLAVLEVADVTKIGAFVKWGLEKDLLLPYSEQTVKVNIGDRYLMALYVDKSDRLCATMKVYDFLRADSPYRKDDMAEGIVFGENPRFGIFVAIDEKYNGLIQKKEAVRPLRIGERVRCRVLSVREDGKLNLSLREKAHLQMDRDAEQILQALQETGGFLPYHDKSSPEEIRRAFSMSKNEYKRAIGRLYKERRIRILKDGIQLADHQE